MKIRNKRLFGHTRTITNYNL